VALLIEVPIERQLGGSGRTVWDDGDGTGGNNGGTEVIGVIGRVGHHDGGALKAEKGRGLRHVAFLPGGQTDADGTAKPTDGDVDLSAQATAGAAKGLIFSPFFAPAACWCARTIVESRIKYSKSGSSAIAVKMRCQMPFALHRLKRRKALFQLPNTSGRSRQGAQVRTIHSTPSTNIRLSRPVEPRV